MRLRVFRTSWKDQKDLLEKLDVSQQAVTAQAGGALFLGAFNMFGSVRFQFGKQNFN